MTEEEKSHVKQLWNNLMNEYIKMFKLVEIVTWLNNVSVKIERKFR